MPPLLEHDTCHWGF